MSRIRYTIMRLYKSNISLEIIVKCVKLIEQEVLDIITENT